MLPLGLEAKLIGIALAVAALLAALWGFIHHEREIGAEKVKAAVTAEAQKQATANAIETARRESAQQEISREAESANVRARDDHLAAAGASARLLQRLARRSPAASDPAAADPGAPASGAATVPLDVFVRIDDAAGQLGAYADQLRISLDACTGSYNALTKPAAGSAPLSSFP